MFRKKVILEFYHLLGKRTVDKYGFAGWFPWYFEKLMLRHSKTIITMALGTKTLVLEMFPDKKIYALPCGFDEKQLELLPEDHKYILVFGRIDIYMKGIDRLIPVMSKVLTNVDGYRLKIAGRGSYEDIRTLHKLVEESGIRDKVDIVINPSYDEKLELFKKCTFVAIFSRFEGWCIVAIEAAAAGKAILGVDVEGLRDSVNNGYNGILVKDFDADELVEIGGRFLQDCEFRRTYEKNARLHASQYTWEKIALMQANVYNSIVCTKPSEHA
jgi:glycosyltransferase involved in cell wall biosynthesis